MRFRWVFVCIIATIIASCFQDYKIDDSDNVFPIKLTLLNSSDENIQIQWTETKVTTFKRYAVVKSTTEIPTGLKPNFAIPISSSFTIIGEIYEGGQTTLDDVSIFPGNKAYYKVYVDLGDRFLESNNLEVDVNAYPLDGSGSFFMIDKDSLRFVFTQNNNTRSLVSYNLIKKEIENKADANNFFVQLPVRYAVLHTPSPKFIFNQSSNLSSISLPSLSFGQELSTSTAGFNSIALTSKFLVSSFLPTSFSSTKDCIGYYKIDNGKLTQVVNATRPDPFEKRILKFVNDALFLEISTGKCTKVALSNTGYENSVVTTNVPDLKILLDAIVLNKDKNNFIATKDGDIYRVSNYQKLYDSDCQTCSNYVFSNNGEYVYRVRINEDKKSLIEKIDWKNNQVVKTYNTDANLIIELYQTNDKLGIIMTNRFNQFFVKEVEI